MSDLDQASEVDVEALPESQLRRLHPLTPIFRSWRFVTLATAIMLGVFRDNLDRVTWAWHALHGDYEVGALVKAGAIATAVALVVVAGAFLSWRTTYFAIIDDGKGPGTLLFHRGIIRTERSQVRLNRVQSVDINEPLVPRLAGLASVKLDMAAGDEASVDLAYLRLADATALRTEIIRHMRGQPATTATTGSDTAPPPDEERLLAEASTALVIKSNLLDGITAWVLAAIWLIALIVVPFVFGTKAFFAAVGGILPVTIAILAQLRRQLMSMLREADFKLYWTGTGIRITAGLTTAVSKTIDLHRIQGIRLVEPFLWRRFGWARVKVDIAGASDDFEKGASLIPVADRASALELIRVITDVRLDDVPMVAAGKGSKRLDPAGWRYLGVGLAERGAVTKAGRWRRETAYVAYGRVQSVSAEQGSLQRTYGVATVYVDVAKGAARWKAQHRDRDDAADLVKELAARARQHRAAELGGPLSESAGDARDQGAADQSDDREPDHALPAADDRP